jgi:hypothetical protein
VLSSIRDLLQQLLKQVKPPKPFSWQMLVLLSLFSFLISRFIENVLIQAILTTIGWGFLILAIGWATAALSISLLGFKFFPGSWLTGAMVLSLLRDWGLVDLGSLLLFWPIVTAFIASIPRFLAPGPNLRIPKPSDRQYIVITVLSHIVMSCWVGFGFLIQGWISDYPATLVDTFDRSAFVVRIALDVPTNNPARLPSETMLNRAQQTLEASLKGKSWDETIQWLRNDNRELAILREQVLEAIDEDNANLWDFGTIPPKTIQGIDDGYSITFRSFWRGPSSHPDGYYMDKTCNLLNRDEYQQLQQERQLLENAEADEETQNEAIEESDTLESIRDTVLEQLQRLPDRLLPEEEDADAPDVTILCEDTTDVKYPEDAKDESGNPTTADRLNPVHSMNTAEAKFSF